MRDRVGNVDELRLRVLGEEDRWICDLDKIPQQLSGVRL